MNCSDFNNVRMAWLDLDDTLIDFRANSRAALRRLYDAEGFDRLWPDATAWTEAYEGHNYPLWVDYAAARVDGPTLRMERFRRPLTDAGMPDAEARVLSSRLDTEYLDFLVDESSLVDGAGELLEFLRSRGIATGILSNGFADVQHRKIARAGLGGLIDITVLSDDIGVNKPDRRLFAHAQRLTAWPDDPKAHLMIGDNPATDIGGALGAGWNAVWYNPGNYPGTPQGAVSVTSLVRICHLLG